MLPRAKWIKNASPDDPVSRVARRALNDRLKLIWHYLPLAATEPEEEIEYIHQLRVATRRASAAMELFKPLLPKRRAHKLRKKLRRVRKAAGEARDLDVLMERIEADKIPLSPEVRKRVMEHLRERREEAQTPVARTHGKLEDWNYADRVEQLLDRVRWRDDDSEEPSYGDSARQALAPLSGRFFDLALGDLSTPEALHELRISGKALRYALELLAAAFPTTLRSEIYPQVEQIQKQLGEVNDHASAHARYRSWSDLFAAAHAEDELTSLLAHEQQELSAAADAFRQRWLGEPIDRLADALEQLLKNSTPENLAGSA